MRSLLCNGENFGTGHHETWMTTKIEMRGVTVGLPGDMDVTNWQIERETKLKYLTHPYRIDTLDLLLCELNNCIYLESVIKSRMFIYIYCLFRSKKEPFMFNENKAC